MYYILIYVMGILEFGCISYKLGWVNRDRIQWKDLIVCSVFWPLSVLIVLWYSLKSISVYLYRNFKWISDKGDKVDFKLLIQ